MRWSSDGAFDRALGIDTSLTDKSWARRRQSPCQPTPLAALEAVAQRLGPEDCVVDYGCGTGRAVFCLAAAAGCRAIGVELDPRRYAQAAENLARCRRRAPEVAGRIRLVNGAAQDYVPGEEVTAFYCFNPFPAAVLRGALRRIAAHCRRPVRMFCYYPDDGWRALLAESGWRPAGTIDLRGALGRDERERVDVFEWGET